MIGRRLAFESGPGCRRYPKETDESYFAEKTEMKYEMKPCSEDDTEFRDGRRIHRSGGRAAVPVGHGLLYPAGGTVLRAVRILSAIPCGGRRIRVIQQLPVLRRTRHGEIHEVPPVRKGRQGQEVSARPLPGGELSHERNRRGQRKFPNDQPLAMAFSRTLRRKTVLSADFGHKKGVLKTKIGF